MKKTQTNEKTTPTTLKDYMALPYPIEIVQDEDSWVAASRGASQKRTSGQPH